MVSFFHLLQTINAFLWLYLAYQNISALAPKEREDKKELTADEKNIRWDNFINDVCFRDMSMLSEIQRKAVLCFWYDLHGFLCPCKHALSEHPKAHDFLCTFRHPLRRCQYSGIAAGRACHWPDGGADRTAHSRYGCGNT